MRRVTLPGERHPLGSPPDGEDVAAQGIEGPGADGGPNAPYQVEGPRHVVDGEQAPGGRLVHLQEVAEVGP